MIKVTLLITFTFLFAHAGTVKNQAELPDLVIEHVSYSVVSPKFSPDRKVKRAESWRSGELQVLIRNVGKGIIHEAFYIAVEPGNTTRVNSTRNILFEDDTMTVIVHTTVYEPGTHVHLFLQPVRAGDIDLTRIDEINYDNNRLEFVVPEE